MNPPIVVNDTAASNTVVIDTGGLTVAIECDDPTWRALARARWRDYVIDRPADLWVRYCVDSPTELDEHELAAARAVPLRSQQRGGDLELMGHAFHGRMRGSTVELTGPMATYPVDHILLFAWRRRRAPALVLHAAALVVEGQGLLCTGPSGAGKSTLAKLGQGLCDEFAGVRGDRDFELVGLPFWQGRSGSAPLDAVYLLVHGHRNERLRIGAEEAFARLRAQVVWPRDEPIALTAAFDQLADLILYVPIYEFRFRPEPSALDLLRRKVAA
ncbi:MAG: hypothetical protein AAGD38_14035 [Acidobacteriota bacterium]